MLTNSLRVLGIIPARGGSKGVPRKNIRLLRGKHLIGYSIESALGSGYLTDILVSTDDAEIASISESYGATVLKRPQSLAQDKTPMLPVLQHGLTQAEALNGSRYDYIMILQPTAPMRTAIDIDNAIKVVMEEGCDSLVSLYQVEDCHPSRMYTIDNGLLMKVMSEPDGALRQALPAVYHRNGSIYLMSRALLMEKGEIVSNSSYPYVMPAERSLNIDTELDLEYAEFIFQRQLGDNE